MKIRNSPRKIQSLKTKHEAIFNDLRELIVHHRIAPGARLSDIKLAEEYKVSRTLIRDVFRELEHRGLIETHRNRGTFVIRMDVNDILELLEVREALEGMMARLSAQRSTPDDWKGIENLFDDECARIIQNLDFEEYLRRVALFHDRIVRTARNRQLQHLIESIYDRIRMVMRRTAILPGRAQHSILEHREVLQAILAHDPDKAEASNRSRIRKVRENVQHYQNFIL